MEQQQKAPKNIRKVVDFLRSSKAGMKNRQGILNGKRVDYFKGKHAVKAVLSPAYAKLKDVPKVTTEEEATALLNSIIPYAFYLRVDRGGGGQAAGAVAGAAGASNNNNNNGNGNSSSSGGGGNPKTLTLNQMQMFRSEDLYAWFYEGPMWTTYLGGIAMVTLLLAGVMFPLWPPTLRLGVWYLSIGVLGLIGLFVVIAILRLVFYVVTIIVAPPGIWVFPKLFADVGVIESFIPLWEWDMPKKKKSRKHRSAAGEDVSGISSSKKGKGKAVGVTDSGINTPQEERHGNGTTGGTGTGVQSEVEDTSGDSRPVSRNRSARVEDVPSE